MTFAKQQSRKREHGLATIGTFLAVAFASLCSIATFSQVTTTVNGSLTAGLVNNVAYVDGTTYTSPQSVFVANPSFTGDLYWPVPYGQTPPTFLTDPFLNAAASTLVQPTVTLSGTCVHTVPIGDYEEVVLALYDAEGNVIYSPAGFSPQSTTGTLCYTVTVPTADIVAGAAYGAIFGEACPTNPCSSFQPTLQEDVHGNTTFNQAGAIPNMQSTTASNGPGVQPVAPDTGLLVQGVRLHLVGAQYLTQVPIVVPNPGVLEGMMVGQGSPSNATQLALAPRFPYGVPVAPGPVGELASGGSGTSTYSVTVQTALTFGVTSPYTKVMSVSRPETFGPFTTTLNQVNVLNPLPPQGYWPWQNSAPYWIGSFVDDETSGTNSCGQGSSQPCGPCLWQATGLTIPGYYATSSAHNPFTNNCTSGTVGSTTTSDGSITWTLAMIAQGWLQSHLYSPGDEAWDPTNSVFQEMVQSTNCTSGTGAPPFSSLFGDYVTETSGCKWMNIGKNAIPHPGFMFYAASCSSSYCIGYYNNSTYNAGAYSTTSGPNYAFSGCTNIGSAVATCMNNQHQLTTAISQSGANTNPAPPSNVTLTNTSCPSGLPANLGSTSVGIQLMWATQQGLTPPFAEDYDATASMQCIQITPPSLANSPPNAIGYVIGTVGNSSGLSFSGNELLLPPDGINLVSNSGGSSNYVNGLQHGQIIPLNTSAILVADQAHATDLRGYGLGSSVLGLLNTTEVMLSLGGEGGIQPQTSRGGQYYSRVQNINLEASRSVAVNNLEPQACGVENHSAQEHSGVFSVQLNDFGSCDVYVHGSGGQNSSIADVHDAGNTTDYKEQFAIEQVGAFRGIFGGSYSGSNQGTQVMSRDAIHFYTPLWTNLTHQQAIVLGGSAEATLNEIECSNCGMANFTGGMTTTIGGRQALNTILFDQGSHDWTVSAWNIGGSGCTVMDTTLSSSCLTTEKYIGFMAAGNIGGNASASETFFSTDPSSSFNWFSNPSGGSTGSGLTLSTAETAYFGLLTVPQPTTFSSIIYYVQTADPSNKYDLWLASCPSHDCSQPSVTATVVCNIGGIALSSGAQKTGCTQSTPITINPGVYILAACGSATIGKFGDTSASVALPFSASSVASVCTSGVAGNFTTPSAGSAFGAAGSLAFAIH